MAKLNIPALIEQYKAEYLRANGQPVTVVEGPTKFRITINGNSYVKFKLPDMVERMKARPDYVPKKKVVVRWTAVYETILEVPVTAALDSTTVMDDAANINLDVMGSEYQTDTWEVESIKDKTNESND